MTREQMIIEVIRAKRDWSEAVAGQLTDDDIDLRLIREAERMSRETIARLTAERDAALAPPPAAVALWKDIFGDTYTLTTWGQSEAIHRVRLSQAMRIAQQRAPECADSIAMLIWWRALDAQTAEWLQQEAHKERDAALARVAELEAALKPVVDYIIERNKVVRHAPGETIGDFWRGGGGCRGAIRLIDLERAREVLKGTP